MKKGVCVCVSVSVAANMSKPAMLLRAAWGTVQGLVLVQYSMKQLFILRMPCALSMLLCCI